jgi:hypothetical protein
MGFRFVLFVAAWWAIAGCSSGSNAEKTPTPSELVAPDPQTLAQVEAATSLDEPTFYTAETLDALSYGLVGDGATDNTAVFRSLLSTGNRTIHVPAGDYVTGSLVIPPKTILVLEPGVIIRDSGSLGEAERLINIYEGDVRIDGLGASVVARRSDYTSGEQRHGVFIFGAQRVVIAGLDSSGHGGDGFYIGGPPGDPSSDVHLKGCRADNNRRQGLSITSARRVRVRDCEFTNTNGTAPQFGVDLEPNRPRDFMDDIVLLRPYTRTNKGGGIQIHLIKLDATSHPVRVSVIEHASSAESPHVTTHVPEGVIATLEYSRQ